MTRILNRKSFQGTTGLLIIIIALIGQCMVSSTAFSQADTIPDKVQKDNDSVLYYINPMDYAFMMHEETKWLLKAGILIGNDYTNTNPFKIAFERRISKSFTLNAAMDHAQFDFPGDTSNLFPIHFSLESRWYYRQDRRIREENVSRSMSDNYFALGMAYTQILNNGYGFPEITDENYLSIYAKWGLQRRYLKHGLVDMGVKIGLADALNKEFSPSLVLNTYVDMGLCFTKDKFKLDRDKLCSFIKCYEADRFIIKSNLSDLVNLGFFKYYKWINLSPQIAFERKIGKSPFSINADLNATIGYSEYVTDDTYYNTYWKAGMDLEGRWYYNLKKSIRNGHSGNGLSANYISAGGSYYYVDDKYDEFETETGPQLHVATGWQRLFSKHMYFDIQVGLNYYFEPDRYGNLYFPRMKLALGYRF
jgi:hypothetical protein